MRFFFAKMLNDIFSKKTPCLSNKKRISYCILDIRIFIEISQHEFWFLLTKKEMSVHIVNIVYLLNLEIHIPHGGKKQEDNTSFYRFRILFMVNLRHITCLGKG